MTRQDEIAEEMAVLRAAGAATAKRFPAALDRATDWREYVRAYPLQALAATGCLGYFLVPSKKVHVPESRAADPGASAAPRDDRREKGSRVGILSSLVAPVTPWARAMAVQAVQRAMLHQFNLLMTRIPSDEQHSDRQRDTPSASAQRTQRDTQRAPANRR